MTIHLAVDSVAGVALPNGEIVGIAETAQGLVDQGFSASTYTGNRVSTIDETDSSVWDNDCVPGWYLVGGEVQFNVPVSDLERLKAAYRRLHRQLNDWADGLDALSRGQPVAKVQSGHDWLYYAKYAAYLFANNLTSTSNGGTAQNPRSVNVRIGWAGALAQGALGVTSPAQFYADPNEPNPPTNPISWRNVTSPYAARSLANALDIWPAATAPDVDTIDLATGSWINSLTG